MLRGGELAQRDPPLVEDVALAKRADIALTEQAAAEEAGGELWQKADREIDVAGPISSLRLTAVLRTVLTVTPGAARASSCINRGKK